MCMWDALLVNYIMYCNLEYEHNETKGHALKFYSGGGEPGDEEIT